MERVKHYLRLILNIVYPYVVMLAVVAAIMLLLKFLFPFVLACVMALLVSPVLGFLQRKLRFRKKFASILLTILIIAIVVAAVYFAVIGMIDLISWIVKQLPVYWNVFSGALDKVADRIGGVFATGAEISETADSLRSSIDVELSKFLHTAASSAANISLLAVKSIPSLFINCLVFVLVAFYMVSGWEGLRAKLSSHISDNVRSFYLKFRGASLSIFLSWFKAQLKIMAVIFAFLSVAFLILRVKSAIPIAFLTAFLDFLPAFGVGFTMWPWIAYELITGEYLLALWLAVVYVLTQVIRNTLQPKIMGDTMGLSPLWTLLFLYLGFKISGIAGMIFAVPIGMLLLSLVRFGVFDKSTASAKQFAKEIGEFMKRDDHEKMD